MNKLSKGRFHFDEHEPKEFTDSGLRFSASLGGKYGYAKTVLAMVTGPLSFRSPRRFPASRKSWPAIGIVVAITPLLTLAACSEQPPSVTHDFVHVTKTRGAAGGMLQIRESAYVDSTGLLQTSRETSDDQILELREELRSDSSIFPGIQSHRDMIEALHFRSDPSGTEVDHVPELVYVSLGLADSAILARESGASDVPDDLAKVLGLSDKPFGPLNRELPLVEIGEGTVYLRAIALPTKTGRQFRRDKLTVTLDGAKIPAEGALARALGSPGRLIPVEGETNPFSAFHSRFVPKRSTLAVEVDGGVLQIRSFLADGGSSNLPPKANE